MVYRCFLSFLSVVQTHIPSPTVGKNSFPSVRPWSSFSPDLLITPVAQPPCQWLLWLCRDRQDSHSSSSRTHSKSPLAQLTISLLNWQLWFLSHSKAAPTLYLGMKLVFLGGLKLPRPISTNAHLGVSKNVSINACFPLGHSSSLGMPRVHIYALNATSHTCSFLRSVLITESEYSTFSRRCTSKS